MKVAISTWNNLVAPVFDVSGKLLVLNIDSGIIQSRSLESLFGLDSSAKILRLFHLNIEVLICGAISRTLLDMIAAGNIKVLSFVSGNNEEIIKALLEARLENNRFFMPGCWKCFPENKKYWPLNQNLEVNMPGQGRDGKGQGQKGKGKGPAPGRGRGGGMNVSGFCVCPQCSEKVRHERGKPCYEQKCPGCGSAMTRG